MMVKVFVQIHGSGNLTEEGRRRREITKRQNLGALERNMDMGDHPIICPFTLDEVKRATFKSGRRFLGKDQICYVTMRHLSIGALRKLLALYNSMWKEGRKVAKSI